MKQVLAFNDKGRHLFTIHRVGIKGEYGSILDIAIDRQNENLVFLADPTSLIMTYKETSLKLPNYKDTIIQ